MNTYVIIIIKKTRTKLSNLFANGIVTDEVRVRGYIGMLAI